MILATSVLVYVVRVIVFGEVMSDSSA